MPLCILISKRHNTLVFPGYQHAFGNDGIGFSRIEILANLNNFLDSDKFGFDIIENFKGLVGEFSGDFCIIENKTIFNEI